MKTKSLINAINVFLESIKKDYLKAFEGMKIKIGDPLADVRLITGDDLKKYDVAESVVALLTYDGAGYDFFSYLGDIPSLYHENEAKLSEIAEKYGFEVEPQNNWSTAFYSFN